MEDEKKTKQINKNGILIHKLPRTDKSDALSYFTKECIEKVSCSAKGLEIFFKEYNQVIHGIIRQKIEVNGLFYRIYPMVTNLTIRGIGPYANNSAICSIMQCYGFIIDSYRIVEIIEHDGYETVSLTNDYRIILDIPEVFVKFNLTPVRLPNMAGITFEVLFFCRLCRNNGHMQFQCPRKSSSSFKTRQNMDVSRRISYESDSSNLVVNQNRMNGRQSDFCFSLRDPKICSHSVMKIDKEQNYVSDQICCSKNKSNTNGTPKNCFVKSSFSNTKSHRTMLQIADNTETRKKCRHDHFSSIPIDSNEKYKGSKSSGTKKLPSETLEKKRSFERKKYHQHCGNGEFQASTSSACTDKQKCVASKKKLLSRLLPPNVDFLETKKLIKAAYKSDPKDIPEEVGVVLLKILEYNRGLEKKGRDKKTEAVLKWIKLVLNRMRRAKVQREKSGKNLIKKREQEHIKEEKSTAGAVKQQTPGKRNISLSSGIEEAISKTRGVLQPEFLRNFLNQVRGRKKLFDIASVFTKDFLALASQLLEVQNTYYKYVRKRGPEVDRDINFIKRLRMRLLQCTENSIEISVGKGTAALPFKTENEFTDVLVNSESDFTDIPVKTESEFTDVVVKTESEFTDIPVKTERDLTEVPRKTESVFTEARMETESDMMEVCVKKEDAAQEILMRQTSDYGDLTDTNLSSNSRYPANYFTNITQIPYIL